jgi:RimJ/RimL family protein N-acetyltransferase
MQECWEEMSEDGAELLSVPDLVNENWICMLVDSKYAGFFRFVEITSVMQECHICVLKPFREYAREAGIQCYKMLLKSNIQKLSTNIPSFNKKAIAYAASLGFVRQGENTNSYMKNGKLCSMIQMGIERRAMEELCQQQYQH